MQEWIVVKCGGKSEVDFAAVGRDIAVLRRRRSVVLVHGGSAEIDRLADRLGVPVRRITAPDGVSTRHTDAAMLEVVQLALVGLVKPRLVAALRSAGVSAVGLAGTDGGLVRARRKTAHRALSGGRPSVVRDNHSGVVTAVGADLLTGLVSAGHVPVVSPPAVAEDGGPVNVDADRMAAAIAVALGATTLVLATGVPGVLAEPADDASVLDFCPVPVAGPPPYRDGGMAMKLMAARDALLGGVAQVVVADGRRSRPIRDALDGGGTRVVLSPPWPSTPAGQPVAIVSQR